MKIRGIRVIRVIRGEKNLGVLCVLCVKSDACKLAKPGPKRGEIGRDCDIFFQNTFYWLFIKKLCVLNKFYV